MPEPIGVSRPEANTPCLHTLVLLTHVSQSATLDANEGRAFLLAPRNIEELMNRLRVDESVFSFAPAQRRAG